MYSASFNMATNFSDEELCTSNVISLSTQPNSSSFQNSSTGLVSDMTAECINDSVITEIEENCTPKSKYHLGGSITCCVSTCFNNSVKNKELSFYVIAKDNQLRSKWLSMIGRKTLSHHLLIVFVQSTLLEAKKHT